MGDLNTRSQQAHNMNSNGICRYRWTHRLKGGKAILYEYSQNSENPNNDRCMFYQFNTCDESVKRNNLTLLLSFSNIAGLKNACLFTNVRDLHRSCGGFTSFN